jgi:hypothetical protein
MKVIRAASAAGKERSGYGACTPRPHRQRRGPGPPTIAATRQAASGERRGERTFAPAVAIEAPCAPHLDAQTTANRAKSRGERRAARDVECDRA